MNKAILTSTLIFAAGIGVGFLIGTMTTKKKYADIAQAEIDSVKEHYNKKRRIACENEHIMTPDEEAEVVEKNGPLVMNGGPLYSANEYEAAKRNYNLIKPVEKVTDKTEYYYEEIVSEAEEEDIMNERLDPYLISQEDFENGRKGFDKVTVDYYSVDDVMVEANSQAVIADGDISETVGHECFDILSPEEAIVYVRNNRLEIDYEVLFLDKSYEREVLGIGCSPRELYRMRRGDDE